MALPQKSDRPLPIAESECQWSRRLPVLTSPTVTLRGLVGGDAPALLARLHEPGAREFIAPPPSTLDAMARFIRWTHRARRQRTHLVYGIVPAGHTRPVGIVQLWKVEGDFSVAEWGFALSEQHWGSGLFTDMARRILDLAFGTLGVHRLEARVAERNLRGHAAMRKIGAAREGRLRGGFRNGNGYEDQVMWSLIAH